MSPPPPTRGSAPGAAYSWEGSIGGINTSNGNKLTGIPLVGWTQRGGLPVDITLYHNSETSRHDWLGNKWTFTYDAVFSLSGTTATVAWGDGTTYTYTQSGSNFLCNQPGIYDTLSGSGSDYSIKSVDQVTYHFSNNDGAGHTFSNGFDLTIGASFPSRDKATTS